MISIAFANGAVELAKLNMEHIKAIKKDKKLLRATVYALAQDYIYKVHRMNSVEKKEQDNQGKNYWNH